jgi:hypothetical protein
MTTLNTLTRGLAEVKDRRDSLAARDKALAAEERTLKDAILEVMGELGIDNAKLSDGTGTVYVRATSYTSFLEPEKAVGFMFENMKKAEADGLPLIDHLVTTKAVMKSTVVDWAEKEIRKAGEDPCPENIARELEKIGIRYGIKHDVTLLRGK